MLKKFSLTAIAVVLLFAGITNVHAISNNNKDDILDEVEKTEHSVDIVEVENQNEFEEDKDDNEDDTDAIKQESSPQINGVIDLQIHSRNNTVEVGSESLFELYIGLDNSISVYEDLKVIIDLPKQIDDNQVWLATELDKLSIRGVVPTYDTSKQTLTYIFDAIEGGFQSKNIIAIGTKNGANLNEAVLDIKAVASGTHIEYTEVSASSTLAAKQNISITNKLNKVIDKYGKENHVAMSYNDEAIFSVGVSVNQLKSGSLAIEEDSNVIVTYSLAKGLEYVSNNTDVEPTVEKTDEGFVLVWKFDSNLNQDADYFFNLKLDIRVKLIEELPVFKNYSNMSETTITFVDGKDYAASAKGTFMVAPDYELDPPPSYAGSGYASTTSSPTDAFGNTSGSANHDIKVTDGALLGWQMYLTPMYATTPLHAFHDYNFLYYPDENLEIESFFSGDLYYRPNTNYKLAPMDEEVSYSLSIKYTDSDEWARVIQKVEHSTLYTKENLGLEEGRTVEVMWMHFYADGKTEPFSDYLGSSGSVEYMVIPAGLTIPNMKLLTTVKKGYLGTVKNKSGISFSGWNTDNNGTSGESKDYIPSNLTPSVNRALSAGWQKFLDPKTAQIVEAPTGINRYVRASTYFETTKKSTVDSGPQTLRFDVVNDEASLSSMSGPLIGYALLPKGVIIDEVKDTTGGVVTVIDDNYEGLGKTLIKLEYDKETLTIARKTSIAIPVTIGPDAPYKLEIEQFGYLNEDFEVATTPNDDGTITRKVEDTYDFNNNGDFTEPIYVTKNTYIYRQAYEFFGQSLVKDYLNEDYGVDAKVLENNTATLKLTIENNKNNPIRDFVLINTLPTVGDLYVLSDQERSSKYDATLEKAITLPVGYEDYFDVYYSTSSNPLVEGVLDNNVDPLMPQVEFGEIVDDAEWHLEADVSDFKVIKSFKVVKKNPNQLIHEDILEITFDVRVPEMIESKSIEDNIAYNSFAFAVNESSVLESVESGLILSKALDKYEIEAQDVILKVSDANALAKENKLIEYIREHAKPLVTNKTTNETTSDNIDIEIMTDHELFEVDEYDVNFKYDLVSAGVETDGEVTTKARLIIIKDDEEIDPGIDPEDPEPGIDPEDEGEEIIDPGTDPIVDEEIDKGKEDIKDDGAEIPETGIQSNYIIYGVIALGSFLLIMILKRMKQEDLKQ